MHRKVSTERLFADCERNIEAKVDHSSYDPAKTSGPIERLTASEDSSYANGYSHYSIHQEMLQVTRLIATPVNKGIENTVLQIQCIQ